jgi:hypothetical protein
MIGALLVLIILLLCTPRKERWMTVVGTLIVFALWKTSPFFVAVFAYWMPSIRQHWVISWLVVSALIILPSMYFGTRSDIRQNEAIRAGCEECFDKRVQHLVRKMKYSQEQAVVATQRVKDSKEPSRWITTLFGRRGEVISKYHVLH